MKHLTSKLIFLAFIALVMLASCEYEYYVIPPPVPKVSSTDPHDTATSVYLSKKISVTFDMIMDSSSINWTTFTVKNGTTAVAGTFSYSDATVTFIPSGYLTGNTNYTATITTGVINKSGIPLAKNYVWTFTTGTDTTGNDSTGVVADKYSFEKDIIPFFTSSCVACHKGSQAPDLRANMAYSSLMNGNYVVAKDPDNSLIYQKCNTGGSMKNYASPGNLKLLKGWILEGAKNN